jgi:hypothetical protein
VDALILDLRSNPRTSDAEVLTVALIDTTGAARFAAMGRRLTGLAAAAGGAGTTETAAVHDPGVDWACSVDALPWPEVHGALVQALEGASVVLAWDAPSTARTLARAARIHGLPLPTIPWRDLSDDYRGLGYLADSLATVAKRHAANGSFSGPLAPCHRALSVMRACSH